MTNKEKKEIQELLKLNRTDKLWKTEDGVYFLNENSAKNHALREHGKMREKSLKVALITADNLPDESSDLGKEKPLEGKADNSDIESKADLKLVKNK